MTPPKNDRNSTSGVQKGGGTSKGHEHYQSQKSRTKEGTELHSGWATEAKKAPKLDFGSSPNNRLGRGKHRAELRGLPGPGKKKNGAETWGGAGCWEGGGGLQTAVNEPKPCGGQSGPSLQRLGRDQNPQWLRQRTALANGRGGAARHLLGSLGPENLCTEVLSRTKKKWFTHPRPHKRHV